MSRPDRARRWAALLLVIYVGLVAVVGIIPRPIDQGFTPWLRGVLDFMHHRGFPGVIDYEFLEYAAHVVLLVPFGILLAVALGRRLAWLTAVLAVGTAVLAELGTSWLTEEAYSQLDLALNVVGVVLGAAVGWWTLTPYARAARRAIR